MSDKAAVEEVPLGTTAKPSFLARVKAHFKKWWWAHLIALAVIVLVIALPLVYVGYPRIAQGDINDSTLDVTSMEISDPSPDGFHLNQKQVIGSGSTFKPKLFSFDADVSLLGSSKFAMVTVPEVQGRDGYVVDIDQWVDLSSVEDFEAFSIAVMMNEEFKLNIYGEPRLKLGALPTIDIDYNKTITMKGLNKLNGFKIEKLGLNTDLGQGRNAEGTVLIPNPSVLTLTMGNLTLDVSSNGTKLGQSFLDDLVLHPGDNHVPMTSFLNISTLADLLPRDGIMPLTIVGNSSVYNGEPISYFTKALQANTLNTNVNLSAVLG